MTANALKITPYAEQLLARNGRAALPRRPNEDEEEIGTREAGEILGLSQRRIQAICDEGILLVENKDWRQLPALPGSSRGGQYFIKRASVLRLKGVAS